MKILVINGPNINMIGRREPEIYGKETYNDLENLIKKTGSSNNLEIEIFQSNHEGDIVDKIQESIKIIDGIVINAGAYTHTSIAIRDAFLATEIPFYEVHLSEVSKRESFRQINFLRDISVGYVEGEGINGYKIAVENLIAYLKDMGEK